MVKDAFGSDIIRRTMHSQDSLAQGATLVGLIGSGKIPGVYLSPEPFEGAVASNSLAFIDQKR